MKKPLFKLGFMVGLYNGLMVIYKMGYIYIYIRVYIYTRIYVHKIRVIHFFNDYIIY